MMGRDELIPKRFLPSGSTTALVGFTTSYDPSSNKLFERALTLGPNDDYSSAFTGWFKPSQKVVDKCLCTKIQIRQYVSERIFSPLCFAGTDGFILDLDGDRYAHQTEWTAVGTASTAYSTDTPGGGWFTYWACSHFTQRFITQAICVSGAESGKIYGSVEWGQEFDGDKVTRWVENKALVSGDRTSPKISTAISGYIPID